MMKQVPQEGMQVQTTNMHVTESQLMQYASQRLSGKEEQQVSDHIQLCKDCQFRLRAVERAQELLRAAKMLPG